MLGYGRRVVALAMFGLVLPGCYLPAEGFTFGVPNTKLRMGATPGVCSCTPGRGLGRGGALVASRPGILVPYNHGLSRQEVCRPRLRLSAEPDGGSSEPEDAGGQEGAKPGKDGVILDGATATRRGHGGGIWNGLVGAWEDRDFDKAIFALAIPALGSLIIEPVRPILKYTLLTPTLQLCSSRAPLTPPSIALPLFKRCPPHPGAHQQLSQHGPTSSTTRRPPHTIPLVFTLSPRTFKTNCPATPFTGSHLHPPPSPLTSEGS